MSASQPEKGEVRVLYVCKHTESIHACAWCWYDNPPVLRVGADGLIVPVVEQAALDECKAAAKKLLEAMFDKLAAETARAEELKADLLNTLNERNRAEAREKKLADECDSLRTMLFHQKP